MAVIPVFMTATLFRTIGVLIGPDMLKLVAVDNPLYVLMNMVYNAGFYFLPFYLGCTAARQLGASPVLGMFTAGILLEPSFVQMAADGTAFSVYGIPAPALNYVQTVVPILLCVWALSYVERFFRKVVPDMLQMVFAPFLTMVVMLPLALCLFGPIGSWIGELLGDVLFSFSNGGGILGIIALAIVAALWEFLVMTGMHQVLIALAMAQLATVGSDTFVCIAGSIATWAAWGMALGGMIRLKGKGRSLSLGYFISAVVGGVTEPVLYGVGLRYKRPFIGLIIGGLVGGLYAGIVNLAVYVVGSANILALLGFVQGGTANTVNAIIACILSMVVSAIATALFGFTKQDIEESAE